MLGRALVPLGPVGCQRCGCEWRCCFEEADANSKTGRALGDDTGPISFCGDVKMERWRYCTIACQFSTAGDDLRNRRNHRLIAGGGSKVRGSDSALAVAARKNSMFSTQKAKKHDESNKTQTRTLSLTFLWAPSRRSHGRNPTWMLPNSIPQRKWAVRNSCQFSTLQSTKFISSLARKSYDLVRYSRKVNEL